MLLLPRVGIWPWDCQSLNFQALAISFFSVHPHFSVLGFESENKCFVPVPFLKHVPHTLSFLCHNCDPPPKKKKTRKQKTIFKPQKLSENKIGIFSSTFTFSSHCSERSSWYFLFLSPLPISFSVWSLSLSLSLTILPGCYPTGLSSFSLYKHITQKNTKKTGNAIIKLSLPPRHSFLDSNLPFSTVGRKKKVTRALLSNVIIYSAWNVLQETLIRPHVW